MQLMVVMLIVFVFAVSARLIYKGIKRRKNEKKEYDMQMDYKRRINTESSRITRPDEQEFVTRYNSPVDYREPAGKDDYSDWE
jgi:predicted Holliday junction resolvase-like endonuclease